MLDDCTASTTGTLYSGSYLSLDSSSPSTMHAIQKEHMRRKFDEGYRKAMDEVVEKQKVENGKSYKPVAGKAKEAWIRKPEPGSADWHRAMFGRPPGPISVKAKKERMNMVNPDYDPYHEPDEFTQLCNHDFHKLLGKFEALLDS